MAEKTLRRALQTTLQNLKLDYLDLYLIHWPIPLKPGAIFPSTPLPISQRPATRRSRRPGREWKPPSAPAMTRHIGVSNFSVKKLQDLAAHCKIRPEVNQVELHPLLQQPELVNFCASLGVHITAWAPLGSADRPDSVKKPTRLCCWTTP